MNRVVMGLIVLSAKYLFVVILALSLVVFARLAPEARRLFIMRATIVLIVSVALAKIGGASYYESRPFITQHTKPLIAHAPDNGFPSDHTLLSFACAFLLLPFSRKAALGTGVLAALVGISRIACLLHTPLDIGASIVFAMIANGVAYFVFKRKPV